MKSQQPQQPRESRQRRQSHKSQESQESQRPMRRVLVWNQKGGTGKTTTAVSLAAALGEAGGRALLCDLDPSGDASDSLGAHWEPDDKDAGGVPLAKWGGRGLLEVFTGQRELATLVEATQAPGVDIIPASQFLIGLEQALAGELAPQTLLRDAFASLPPLWDVVIIDCPPSVSMISINALAACSEVLVPVSAQYLPLKGVKAFLRTLEKVRKGLNPELRIAGVVVCCAKGTRLAKSVTESLRARFGSDVFRTVVRESTRLAEAAGHKMPVTLYDPEGNGAVDYRALAAELLERWGAPSNPSKPTNTTNPTNPSNPRNTSHGHTATRNRS
jgi:chromosome partitioning protein